MAPVKRNWSDAESKRGPCRNCGKRTRIELDHHCGRKHDKPEPRKDGDGLTKTLWVDPDAVIPLCSDCHRLATAKQLDRLPLLTVGEQLYAVRALGGIELARVYLAPSAYGRQHDLFRR